MGRKIIDLQSLVKLIEEVEVDNIFELRDPVEEADNVISELTETEKKPHIVVSRSRKNALRIKTEKASEKEFTRQMAQADLCHAILRFLLHERFDLYNYKDHEAFSIKKGWKLVLIPKDCYSCEEGSFSRVDIDVMRALLLLSALRCSR